MKSSHFLSEGFVEDANNVHLDHEVQMARADCFHVAEDALALHKLLRNIDEQQGLEGWVSAKITLASDYLKTVREYLEYELMTGHGAGNETPMGVISQAPGAKMLPVAEGAELKKAKRSYNQAAKDANADQVGAGKKIDTMKKSLRQKDVNKKDVAEGMLDAPGEQDSPVAQAIIRRILMQRTDLLAKYGPEKVGAAVDEVADFVGDVDEIGSSDVSGWVRHVEQMLGNMGEQGVAEASPQATFNALKGLKSWQVVIRNNYYNGKYTDYSGRYYYVLASSPEEAEQVVLDNADAILQDLLSMKSHNGRKILPRGSAVRITADRIGQVKDGTEAGRMTTAGFKKMYGPQGPMMVKLNNGAIADVQGQEQGVAEGSEYKSRHAHKQEQDKAYDEYRKKHATSRMALMTRAEFAKDQRERKAKEKQGVAEGGFDDASPMTKDTVKSDRIRSLKNLIAIAKEKGRQLRVQELELELKKLQGVAEETNDYFKRRKDEEDRIAGTKAPAKRTPKQTDYAKKRKEQGLAETSAGAVATVVNPKTKNKAKVGSLFGGTYNQTNKAK